MSLLLTKASKLRVFDGFNRANGLPGIADTGQAWEAFTGGYEIENGQLKLKTAVVGAMTAINSGEADCRFSAFICALGVATARTIRPRVSASGKDRLLLYIATPSTLTLAKTINEVVTVLATVPSGVSSEQSHELFAVLRGAEVSVGVNGVELITTTINDVELINNTRHGISASAIDAAFDILRVEVL